MNNIVNSIILAGAFAYASAHTHTYKQKINFWSAKELMCDTKYDVLTTIIAQYFNFKF